MVSHSFQLAKHKYAIGVSVKQKGAEVQFFISKFLLKKNTFFFYWNKGATLKHIILHNFRLTKFELLISSFENEEELQKK